MLFAMNLMSVPGMLVCSSFLISVCIFIVLKALLISSATVIVRVGGAIWLNPFATVLFLCVILHTMWSGKSLQLLCILPFGMLCLSTISMMFVKEI